MSSNRGATTKVHQWLMDHPDKKVTAGDVARAVGIPPKTATQALSSLAATGRATRVGYALYRAKPETAPALNDDEAAIQTALEFLLKDQAIKPTMVPVVAKWMAATQQLLDALRR